MSPSLSWILLFVINIAYVYYEYLGLGVSAMTQGQTFLKVFIYLFLSILVQSILNVFTVKNMCNGVVSIGQVIANTAIPWFIIMGVILAILNMPFGVGAGWKSPFANTIGYLFIYSKAKLLVNQMLKPVNSNVSGEMAEALNYIYKDKSALINEITPNNFDGFWDKFSKSGLLASNVSESTKSDLRNLVNIKDAVATFVWITLASVLVQSFVYQRVVSYGCAKTSSTMNTSEQKYLNSLQEESKQASKKIYVTKA